MPNITITEALVELKTLDKRIDDLITQTPFVSHVQGKRTDNAHGVEREKFEKTAASRYQSIKDLIARRNTMKSLLVESNAKTMVNINGADMTVAAAIERKNGVKHELKLATVLQSQFSTFNQQIINANNGVQSRLDALLAQLLGSDKTTDRTTEAKVIEQEYRGSNEFKLQDPLSAVETSKKIALDVDEFLKRVDVVLSISNANTFIELP